MDMHLNFIVDQTQKYSSWLMKGMATTPTTAATPTDPSLSSTASHNSKWTREMEKRQLNTVLEIELHVCT